MSLWLNGRGREHVAEHDRRAVGARADEATASRRSSRWRDAPARR